MNIRKILIFAFPLLLLSFCAEPEPIKIGFSANLTGRLSDVGVDARNGALLAVEEINRAGGINGRKLEFLVRDDQNDPKIAVKMDKELIDLGVVAIVGHILSGMSRAVLPLINEKKMLLLSPTSVSDFFTGKDDYFIRLSPSTRLVLNRLAEFVFKEKNIKSLSLIYDESNLAYTKDWYSSFSSGYKKSGGKMLNVETFNSKTERDFYALAQKLLKQSPAGVVLVAGAFDSAMLAQQIRKINSKVPLIICGWAMTDYLIQHGGKAVEDAYISYNFDKDSKEPEYVRFKKNFLDRFERAPNFTAKYSYEAVYVLYEVLKEMGNPSPEKIRKAILEKGTFQGLMGKIQIDSFGDAQPQLTLFTVKNGKFVRIY
jgi:branched-chain amino acid transport system substrate-binding protein